MHPWIVPGVLALCSFVGAALLLDDSEAVRR
jgi:hypothetical protein